MDMSRRQGDELREVVRVVLLVQGAILVATTIEALIWSIAFAGAAGPSFVMSATMAATLLVARAHLRVDRRWSRRLVYIVEGVLVGTLAIDTALALAITGTILPPVALLTRFVLPLSVIALLRRAVRVSAARNSADPVAALEAAA